MSTPYEVTGRTDQKRRTRAALVAGARDQVAAGLTPTVEGAAARAGVSRTAAYRYFPNQRALLMAAHPETAARSLLPDDAPVDVEARLDAVVAAFTRIIVDTEAQQRTMLRLSLEADPVEQAALPLRQGRAIGWIEEALEPMLGRLTQREIHQLALAIRSAIGIEALAWLTDIGGLSRDESVALMSWSARAMLHAAVTVEPPPATAKQASSSAR
jgi:AcrR family transcriptional regulator